MKVVAFNGSPRKEGNTYHALSLIRKNGYNVTAFVEFFQ